MPNSVLMIHGAWITSPSWSHFADYLTARDFECVVPPWPFDDRPNADLQAEPNPSLASVGLAELVAHFSQIADGMPEPPLLIGHSFGGLLAQILLDRGLGRAAVAIHPAPGKGVLPNAGIVRANLRPLSTWMGWKKILTMPLRDFERLFANGLPSEQVESEYESQVVPTPGRVFFQAATAPFHDLTRIEYGNSERGPLLLMTGTSDRVIPSSMVVKTYKRHLASTAETVFEEFEGRSHYTIREPGWETVADSCLEFFTGRV